MPADDVSALPDILKVERDHPDLTGSSVPPVAVREEIGPATRLEVEVRSATTRHVVTVGRVLRWTEDGDHTSAVGRHRCGPSGPRASVVQTRA